MDKEKYIVAKNGMEIAAVIMPVDTIKMGFVEKLEALAHKCRVAVEKQEEWNAVREPAKQETTGKRGVGYADSGFYQLEGWNR